MGLHSGMSQIISWPMNNTEPHTTHLYDLTNATSQATICLFIELYNCFLNLNRFTRQKWRVLEPKNVYTLLHWTLLTMQVRNRLFVFPFSFLILFKFYITKHTSPPRDLSRRQESDPMQVHKHIKPFEWNCGSQCNNSFWGHSIMTRFSEPLVLFLYWTLKQIMNHEWR